ASRSARFVARSPTLGWAGTSTGKGGGRSTGSSPAVIASFSAWRRSASRCRFIPVRTAPKPVAGVRREQEPGRDHLRPCIGWSMGQSSEPGGDNRSRGPMRCSGATRPALLRCPRTPSLARGKAAGGSTRLPGPVRRSGAAAAPLPASPTRNLPGRGAPAGGGGFLAAIAPAGFLLLRRLLGLRPLALDQLHDREVCGVTETVAELHHARVAAMALGVARREVVEELLHHARAPEHGRRPPPGMERALLAERDHPVGPAPDLLRLGVRRADRLVLEQRGHQVAEERAAM